MKKGFTLVELLAVIIVVALIVLICSPIIASTLKSMREKTLEQQKFNIESAAKKWALYSDITDSVYCVSIQKLKTDGYLENEDIKDPETDIIMNGSVILEYENNSYSATYQDSACN